MTTAAPRPRAIVTGGSGFLGSHLCDRLAAQGFDILCVDNLSTGSRDNIAHLIGTPGFTFLEQDIEDPIAPAGPVDEIYNLACPASPVHYQADPIRTMRTSVLGALNLLELAKKTGARIMQASTSEVYGDPEQHPQREDYWGHVNPIGIRSCYDEGKRCAETLFFDYHRTHGVKIKVARIFNTYGPRMSEHDGRVVSNLIVQALRGESLTVYGEGTQTRSFCYVDDLVEGFLKLMRSPAEFVGPVNLGNPVEYTILELAEIVKELTGSPSPILHRPLPQDDPRQRRPDISLAAKALDWRPSVSPHDGIGRTIAYFRTKVQR